MWVLTGARFPTSALAIARALNPNAQIIRSCIGLTSAYKAKKKQTLYDFYASQARSQEQLYRITGVSRSQLEARRRTGSLGAGWEKVFELQSEVLKGGYIGEDYGGY